MTKLVFWDVDTLYDFMKSDGKLYVPGSEEIIPAVKTLTDFAHANRIPIVASADNHDLSDAEISDAPNWSTTFPPHCMRGTPGQLKIAETRLRDPLVIEPELQDPAALARHVRAHRGDFLLHKQAVDVFTNANVPALLRALEPEAIVIYGVATDFCDKYAVEGLLRELPKAELYLVTDAVRAINPEEGERLIAEWRDSGISMITVRQIVDENVLDRVIYSTAAPFPEPILGHSESTAGRRTARRPNKP
jgi:nicotinamidase/pyrazinamidase